MSIDNKEHYRRALFAARVQREQLVEQRVELDALRAKLEAEVKKLDRVIEGLVTVYDDRQQEIEQRVKDNKAIPGIKKDLGLADACRVVLASVDRYMSAMRIRDDLLAAKYPLEQTNPLAAIHGVLKRFRDSGEVDSLEVEGKTGYRLQRENEIPKEKKK